jgi:NUMOD4 motif
MSLLPQNKPVMTTTEVWKPIPGYDGLYEVSNLGRVKSLARSLWVESFGRSQRGAYKTIRERILKPINQYGFHAVNLYDEEGAAMKYEIGELVLAAHVRPRPPGKDCCRFDGVKTNNVVTNLYWHYRPHHRRREYFRPFSATWRKGAKTFRGRITTEKPARGSAQASRGPATAALK